MKTLIRRFSRIADSSQYSPLRTDTTSAAPRHPPRRAASFRAAISKAAASRRAFKNSASAPVPEGHVPVYVGDEMERFVVSAELLNHPVFIGLLNKSAQEYGYEQKGVLRIPCQVLVFERVMEDLRLGIDSPDLQHILGSCFDDDDVVDLEFVHFS